MIAQILSKYFVIATIFALNVAQMQIARKMLQNRYVGDSRGRGEKC